MKFEIIDFCVGINTHFVFVGHEAIAILMRIREVGFH